MNETIPRPSHPRSRQIRLGMKIRRFIDKTKSRIIFENRGIFFSSSIYLTAKCMTLAEMKSTTLENRVPQGSQMIGRVIKEALKENKFQVIIIVILVENKYKEIINGTGNIIHKSFLKIMLEIGIVYNFGIIFLTPQVSVLF